MFKMKVYHLKKNPDICGLHKPSSFKKTEVTDISGNLNNYVVRRLTTYGNLAIIRIIDFLLQCDIKFEKLKY